MSLAAVWRNCEQPGSPSLWMATDSRLSDEDGRLIDQGIKLFEVPILCQGPGDAGFFGQPFAARSVGMAAAGSSMVFQHVYGTIVPILGNLIGEPGSGPSNADVAGLIGRVTTIYVRSLGERRPQGARRVAIAVGGVSSAGEVEAFELASREGEDGRIEFVPKVVDLIPGQPHFMGHQVERARSLCAEIARRNEPGAPRERAALNVIRAYIDDPEVESVGGEVQIGFTMGASFHRVASVRPIEVGAPPACMLLNSIDLDSLDHVGPCAIGIHGMVSP